MQLPVSPACKAFAAYCQRRQLDYIAAERWRYQQALERAPKYRPGGSLSRYAHTVWDALDLHPQTQDELKARLVQLDEMEHAALHGPDFMPGGSVPFTAALLHNRPDS